MTKLAVLFFDTHATNSAVTVLKTEKAWQWWEERALSSTLCQHHSVDWLAHEPAPDDSALRWLFCSIHKARVNMKMMYHLWSHVVKRHCRSHTGWGKFTQIRYISSVSSCACMDGCGCVYLVEIQLELKQASAKKQTQNTPIWQAGQCWPGSCSWQLTFTKSHMPLTLSISTTSGVQPPSTQVDFDFDSKF